MTQPDFLSPEQLSSLQARLLPWVKAETLNGRALRLEDVAWRYDISMEAATQLAAHLAADVRRVIFQDGALTWDQAPPLKRGERKRKRDQVVRIPVTAEEKAALERQAEGQELGAWLRARLGLE